MFRWRLYYEDGTTFSDADGQPHESPPWGVVAIGQPGAVERGGQPYMVGNGDWYLYRADLGYWHEVGDRGFDDHMAHFAHLIACVRKGRWMPREDEFKQLIKRVREEAGFRA